MCDGDLLLTDVYSWKKFKMANKLAGQKAKYTRALADYNRTEDVLQREGPLRRMKEVLDEAPGSGFSLHDVTSGRDLPTEPQNGITQPKAVERSSEDPEQLVQQLAQVIDTSELREEGQGDQFIYAYGYSCAPDRLKVGRTEIDVVSRVAQQIHTSTPDKPSLFLIIRTSDCRALEMAMHGVLRLRDRKIVGGGSEWFMTTRDELLSIYQAIDSLLKL